VLILSTKNKSIKMDNMTNKTAIIILSDPKAGSEEALGRAFNAMAAAYDHKQAGDEVIIIFQGTGTRWPSVLQKQDHPLHSLYKAVEDKVKGISAGCADVFGADSNGLELLTSNDVPGTAGLPSLVKLEKEGYSLQIF
jgi:hypothetical protein